MALALAAIGVHGRQRGGGAGNNEPGKTFTAMTGNICVLENLEPLDKRGKASCSFSFIDFGDGFPSRAVARLGAVSGVARDRFEVLKR